MCLLSTTISTSSDSAMTAETPFGGNDFGSKKPSENSQIASSPSAVAVLGLKRVRFDDDDDDTITQTTENKKMKTNPRNTITATTTHLSLTSSEESEPGLVVSAVAARTANSLGVGVGVNDLPQEFKNLIQEMNGTDVILVIEKTIRLSDLDEHQARLLIPFGKMTQEKFLKDDEKAFLDKRDKKGTPLNGLQVKFIEPSLNQSEVIFKKRILSGKENYALITTWNKIVKDNRQVIVEGAILRLYSFRVGHQLWMALVPTVKVAQASRTTSKRKSVSKVKKVVFYIKTTDTDHTGDFPKKKRCLTSSKRNVKWQETGKVTSIKYSEVNNLRKRSRKGTPSRAPLF